MTRVPRSLLSAAVVSGLVAGCGSGDESGGRVAPGTPGDQAAARCEQSVQAARQLPSDVGSELKAACKRTAEGDEMAVRRATKRVCKAIVKENVPGGSARDQALRSCEQP